MRVTNLYGLVKDIANLSFHGLMTLKVVVEFKDYCPSLPKDMKHKITQPFFTIKKGTGLGVSITNDVIKARGEHNEVKSFHGQTIFTLNSVT